MFDIKLDKWSYDTDGEWSRITGNITVGGDYPVLVVDEDRVRNSRWGHGHWEYNEDGERFILFQTENKLLDILFGINWSENA